MLKDLLKIVKEFEDKYPESHVGGSIGLYLQGIDLKRNWNDSDIDMKVRDWIPELENSKPNSISDFDYRIDNVDIVVNPESSYIICYFEGVFYRVSKKDDIIFWKKKYAKQGSKKHIKDLFVITGEIIEPKKTNSEHKTSSKIVSDDDLPF
jgi:hypothetical protein